MRMEQLRCLVDIAETRSITATAQKLFMTQPAVSKSIKQLETELGMELLVRSNTGVYLTEYGKKIVEFAERILADEDRLASWVQSVKAEKTCSVDMEIQVCSMSAVTNIVLPDVLAKLNNGQQKISMKISSANNIDFLLEQVQDGSVDIGFLTHNEEALYQKFTAFQEELQLDILALDESIAVMDKKRCKDGQSCFDVSQNAFGIFTIYSLTPTDAVCEETEKNIMVSSNDADFHRRIIEKTNAVTIMPKMAYQYFFNSKKYIGFPISSGRIPLIHGAVYRKTEGVLIKKVADMIRKELNV